MLYRNQASYRRPNTSQPNPGRLKLRIVAVAILLAAFSGHSLWSKHVSAEMVASKQADAAAAVAAEKKSAIFAHQVDELIAANPADDVSVAVATSDGEVQSFGQTSTFDGASTAKLLTAADYLHHVDQGSATLKQRIDGRPAQDWLKTMLVDSDDTAWAELNDYLGHSDLTRYAESLGFSDYNADDNTFSAGDMASLLQKLYDGKLLNDSHQSLVLGYLKQANYRQYIVAAVQRDETVYHKIGIDEDVVNDAAIIANKQHYFTLVIFTNGHGTYNWDVRAQLMQSITKAAQTAFL
jgi:beta-lactamase class A